jgi:[ribosomal protein S5]-alanine N-acetyltransferase
MQSSATATPGLRLRAFAQSDAKRLARIAGVESVVRFTLGIPLPYTETAALEWIDGLIERNAQGMEWISAISWHGRLVGSVGLTIESEHRRAEIGYWLGEDYRGRGFAQAAVAQTCRIAFDQLGLHRLYGLCFLDNIASQQLLLKLGFRKEGRLRGHIVKDDVTKDALLYALTADSAGHLVGLSQKSNKLSLSRLSSG